MTFGRRENTAIIDWAKENGIAVIDDAAQAMFTKQADTSGIFSPAVYMREDNRTRLPCHFFFDILKR
jgi:hypothetical protein